METNEVSIKVLSICREFSVVEIKSHETETFVIGYYAYKSVWAPYIESYVISSNQQN